MTETLKRRRTRHPAHVNFTVSALWLIGYSRSVIAALTGLRRGQVFGIVHELGYSNRCVLSKQQRQVLLDGLVELAQNAGIDAKIVDKVGQKVGDIGRGRISARQR